MYNVGYSGGFTDGYNDATKFKFGSFNKYNNNYSFKNVYKNKGSCDGYEDGWVQSRMDFNRGKQLNRMSFKWMLSNCMKIDMEYC